MSFKGSDFGFVGGAYEAPVTLQDAQRLINWYVEIDPSTNAKEPLALRGCPGLNSILSTMSGPVRGMWVLPGNTSALVVTGNTLFLVTQTVAATTTSLPQFSVSTVGTLLTSSGPVSIADNGVLFGGLGGYAVIVDGTYGYLYRLSGTAGSTTISVTMTNGQSTIAYNAVNYQVIAGATVWDGSWLSVYRPFAIPYGTTVTSVNYNAATLTLSNPVAGSTSAATTGASGTGAVATITFPVQSYAPTVGQTVSISGVTPTGYNGNWVVTASTTSSVSFASTTTGAQTVAGTILLPLNNYVETINVNLPVFQQIVDPAFLGADRVVFNEGWLIFNQPGTRTFYTTAPVPYTVSFAGAFYALKDSSTDNLVTHAVNTRELWLIGERTSEVWVNGGGANFAYQRLPGVAPQIGCAAKHSIIRVGTNLIWLARNEQGDNLVVTNEQYSWERISTHAIEVAISGYTTVADAFAYGYEEDGHFFYVLTFPTADTTWVYDLSSKLWHQRASWDSAAAIYHRHRSNAFMNLAGIRMVGDYQTGQIYQMGRQYFTDNGNVLRCQRRTPHVWSPQNRQRVFQSAIQVEFTPGVGLQTGQGSDPQAMMRWSNDGGFTWSNEHWSSIGQVGQTRNRATWRRLGRARDRIYELNFSDPTARDIVGATLWAETESDDPEAA